MKRTIAGLLLAAMCVAAEPKTEMLYPGAVPGAMARLLDHNRAVGIEDQVLVTIGAGDVFKLGEALVTDDVDRVELSDGGEQVPR